MSRQVLNRSGEMEIFTKVVEAGGFSAAARALRMTPSGISKLITRLEDRLATRLLDRSTRKLRLTAEGQAFYNWCVQILADIEAAERDAASSAAPQGRIRVNANVPLAFHYLLPLLPDFLERNPEISIDVTLTDQVTDLFEERADVAIRTGPLRSSQLIARKLGESGMAVVASPEYLREKGEPLAVADLEHHNCIGFNFASRFEDWFFRDGESVTSVKPSGNAQAGDGETLRRLVLSGLGLGRLALFHVGRDIEEGRLVRVMENLNPGDIQEVYAVFIGQGGHLPARVRTFIDYLVEHVRL